MPSLLVAMKWKRPNPSRREGGIFHDVPTVTVNAGGNRGRPASVADGLAFHPVDVDRAAMDASGAVGPADRLDMGAGLILSHVHDLLVLFVFCLLFTLGCHAHILHLGPVMSSA